MLTKWPLSKTVKGKESNVCYVCYLAACVTGNTPPQKDTGPGPAVNCAEPLDSGAENSIQSDVNLTNEGGVTVLQRGGQRRSAAFTIEFDNSDTKKSTVSDSMNRFEKILEKRGGPPSSKSMDSLKNLASATNSEVLRFFNK